MARRSVALRDQIRSLTKKVEKAANDCEDINSMREGITCITDALLVLDAMMRAIPYEPEDARR
jgi:hypothetical protein